MFCFFATTFSFSLDGAIDALSGWTEMTHDRGNVSDHGIRTSNIDFLFFCFCFRMEQNAQMEIQQEKRRPTVYYVRPNVFQIFFKHSLILVFQQ